MTNRYPCHQFTCFFAPIATDHPAAFVKALKAVQRGALY